MAPLYGALYGSSTAHASGRLLNKSSGMKSGKAAEDDFFNLSVLCETLFEFSGSTSSAKNTTSSSISSSLKVLPPLEGERIGGQFHATKVIGIGGFSVVKLGTHDITRRKVALKVLPQKLISEMGAEKIVAREIRNLRLCSGHPHIATLYDVIECTSTTMPKKASKCTVLAVEYMMGGELLGYMNGQALSPDEARTFFQQLVCGLDFMHSKGIIHRDLKLENILIDASRTKIRIADFGLSYQVKGDPMVEYLHTKCGSPHHAAPEILNKKPYLGPPVDVWSLGVVLYCMLVGDMPFRGEDDDDEDLYRKVRAGDYYVPSQMVWQRKEVLSGMLCVDPVKRLTISQIKGKPWFQQQLPQYLTRSSAETEQEKEHCQSDHRVDTEVVEEVMTLYDMHSREPIKRTDLEKAAASADDAFDTDISGIVRVKTEEEVEIIDWDEKYENEDEKDDPEHKRMMKDLQVSYRLVYDGKHAKKMYIMETSAAKSKSKQQQRKPKRGLFKTIPKLSKFYC